MSDTQDEITEADTAPQPTETSVGPYVLIDRLGSGGMAEVWRARGPDGREVAIKRASGRTSMQTQDRLRREADVRIRHPNVVETIDAGVDADGAHYVVLELLHGQTLEDRLHAEKRLPIEIALDVALQVARGLDVVHAAGVVHRDLKPANVFLTLDGAVKVLDFGIALSTDVTTRVTRPGAVIGTPAYLAPEQARGDSRVDARIDVWALGVLLFECITGRPPFERDGLLATVLAILREAPEPLDDHVEDAPALCKLVARCLEKAPDARPASMGELIVELERISEGESRAGHARRTPITPMRTGESRPVALVLANGVTDGAALERAITTAGAAYFPLYSGRALALWGATKVVGAETVRAARTTLAARAFARSFAIVTGRMERDGGHLHGDALGRAEQLIALEIQGIALDEPVKRELGEHATVTRHSSGVLVLEDLHDAWVREESAPLVARDAELENVVRRITQAFDNRRPYAVALVGSPGMGKSRLAFEIERRVSSGKSRTVVARAVANGPRGSYEPFREMLASVSGPEGSIAARVLGSARLSPEREHAIGPTLRKWLDELGTRERVAPEAIRLALWELFDAWLAQGPLLLGIENAQWADDATLALIDELLQLGDAPLSMVAATPPELFDRDPHRLAQFDRIALAPLNQAHVRELADALFERDIGSDLAAAIAERTGGNPFFVEQILWAIEDGGPAQGEDLPLPTSVEAAIQTQLDSLTEEQLHALRIASVHAGALRDELIGPLGLRPDLVEALVKRRLLVRLAVHGATSYRLFHGLVRDCVVRGIGASELARTHLAIASMLASLERADPELVALHFERGGAIDEAVDWLDRTAGACLLDDRGFARRATDRIVALGRQPSPRALAARGFALIRAGAFEDTAAVIAKLRALRVAAGYADVLEARLVRHTDRIDGAMQYRAFVSGLATDDPDLWFLAALQTAGLLAAVGDAEHLALVETELGRLAPDSDTQRSLLTCSRAWIAWHQLKLDLAYDLWNEAAHIARGAGQMHRALEFELSAADLIARLGHLETSVTRQREILTRCGHAPHALYYTLMNLADALIQLGHFEEALDAVSRADTFGRKAIDFGNLSLARAELGAGHLDLALAVTERPHPGAVPWATIGTLAVRAEALRQSGRTDEALATSAQAVALRDALGALPQGDGYIIAVRIRCLRSAGEREAAEDLRRRSETALRARAALLVTPEAQERFLSGIPVHREILGEAIVAP